MWLAVVENWIWVRKWMCEKKLKKSKSVCLDLARGARANARTCSSNHTNNNI